MNTLLKNAKNLDSRNYFNMDEDLRKWHTDSPIYAQGANLPEILTQDKLDERIAEFIFQWSGQRYGNKRKIARGLIYQFTNSTMKYNDHCNYVYAAFNLNDATPSNVYLVTYIWYTLINFNLGLDY